MSVANASTARTGHGGKVQAGLVQNTSTTAPESCYLIARITQWSIAYSVTEATWADSDSQGYTNRTSGRRDVTGTMTGKLDKDHPAYQNLLFTVDSINPENSDMVSIVLWEDANQTTPDKKWYLPRALITSFNMSFDVDTKAPVEWTANFGADGIFYYPGADNNAQFNIASTFKTLDEDN